MNVPALSDRILRPAQLAEKLGCTRTSLYKWMDAGILPKPIRLGHASVGWRESVIEAWLTAREGLPMQPRK
jgi:prophage regulatory protein